ncbi:hypothetical protein DFQ00_12322 [Paenibacillus barcinonensis]|uniref:Uncharacterized protein n=1 Tax=Paenibacillus barcinonensis TaxID=198119 RepID=A0A2V4UWE0_PAEBA|nr:hypothetical protein DFQ00_12322 [Paenibacillus barcinonensis]
MLPMVMGVKLSNSTKMHSVPGMPHTIGDNVTITINTDTVEEAKSIFGKLEVGGKVHLPIQETFWSPAYGCAAHS